jgi:Ca2+-binding RTX toxin-like protein
MLTSAYEGVQQVQFGDGTTWSRGQLIEAETTGTSGNDILYGSSDGDVFEGKGGNDTAIGGGGNDTFVFDSGDGGLEINEVDRVATDVNLLKLGTGIIAASTSVTVDSGGNIYLIDGVSGDRIKLDSMMTYSGTLNSSAGVQQVQFADGTVWTAQQLVQMAHTVYGTAGADKLAGTLGGSNVFDGKGGGDVETGNGRNDTFVFNQGYGSLEINEWDVDTRDVNVLAFGSGIDPSSLTVMADSGGNLYLHDGISGDMVTLDDLLTNNHYGVQQMQFADGTVWTRSQLVDAETTGTSAADKLYGSTGADMFDGKGGNDEAIGGGGNDTFVYNQGYGSLEINEHDITTSNVSDLTLGAGIVSSSVVVTGDSSGNVYIADGAVGDAIKIDSMMTSQGTLSTYDGVKQVQFADGSVWTAQQLVQMAHDVNGTVGADNLTGTLGGGNIFDGKGGNDLETGNGRNDTFVFDQGYASLEISEWDWNTSDVNVLKLGPGITASALTVTGDSGGNLHIADDVSGDAIKIDGLLSNKYDGVQQVQFSDGTVWSRAQLIAAETTGTSAADTLYGSIGADVLDGKGGSDIEYGSGGVDTYVLQPGYGPLTIVNGSYSSSAAAGTLSIEGVDPDQLWLERVGNDLRIDVMGSSTSATVQNWFSSTRNQLSDLTLNGGSGGASTLDTQINLLVQAMATYSGNNAGFDPTSLSNPVVTDPTVLAAVNAAWHH